MLYQQLLLVLYLYSTGLAFGMEFKDKQYGGKFDWLDIAATEIGGLIGQTLQIVFILIVKYICS